jgi:hypothetical protein
MHGKDGLTRLPRRAERVHRIAAGAENVVGRDMGESRQDNSRGIAVVMADRRAAKVRRGTERGEQVANAGNGPSYVLVSVGVGSMSAASIVAATLYRAKETDSAMTRCSAFRW